MTPMTADGLRAYLTAVRRHPTLVVGHPAPDGDAAVSCVMEGWRRQVTDGTDTLPLLLCDTLPIEVAWLFGEFADILTVGELPADLPVVLTDHHTAPALEGRIIGVVDHHLPSPGAIKDGTHTVIRPVGATTTIVTTAWQRQELIPDPTVARILLGGILLDTDGLSPHKATEEDRQAVLWLVALCGEEPGAFYAKLRERLLSETDLGTLYRRDHRMYAEGADSIGFAVLKVWQHNLPDKAVVRRLLTQEAAIPGRRLCVAKISLYNEDGLQEEYYLTAGETAACRRMQDTVCSLSKGTAVRVSDDEVFLPAGCPRHGRKWYARHWPDILG